MNGLRKPRQPRWTKSNDVMDKALLRAVKLFEHEVTAIMHPAQIGNKALREGVATLADWQNVYSAVKVGLAIEKQGVVRGKRDDLARAEEALDAIERRAMATNVWTPTPLSFAELDDIDDAISFHEFQLRQLSAGEFHRAVMLAVSRMNSSGGNVTYINSSKLGVRDHE